MQKPYADQTGQNRLKSIPYLWPKQLKNHTVWGRSYLYSPCKGVLPPLPGSPLSERGTTNFQRETAFSGTSYYNSLISILLCFHAISQLCSRINSLFYATYHSLWLRSWNVLKKESPWTAKNRSPDLRRRQKRNFSKTRRKLWPTAVRDRVYSYLYSYPPYFSRFSLFLTSGEDLSINARWSSTRRTWLLYYYCPRILVIMHFALCVTARGAMISLAGGISCWHTSE